MHTGMCLTWAAIETKELGTPPRAHWLRDSLPAINFRQKALGGGLLSGGYGAHPPLSHILINF